MAVVLVITFGVLVVGFAYAADQWHRRAEFWEQLYLSEKNNLDRLLDGIDEYVKDGMVPVNEGLVRVWKQSREQNPVVFH